MLNGIKSVLAQSLDSGSISIIGPVLSILYGPFTISSVVFPALSFAFMCKYHTPSSLIVIASTLFSIHEL